MNIKKNEKSEAAGLKVCCLIGKNARLGRFWHTPSAHRHIIAFVRYR